MVHEILLFRPLHRRHCPDILFLVFGQNQIVAPAALSSTLSRAFPFLIRTAAGWLRYGENISPVVPLHIRLEMQFDLAFVVSRAAYSCQGGFSASRTELLAHVLRCRKAAVAPEDELLDLRDPLASLA